MDLTLFDAPTTHGRARATDPQTSLEAARKDRSGVERAVRQLFTPTNDYTPDEAAWALEPLGFRDGTVRSAFSRLCRSGVLVRTGERRQTRAKCSASVWKLATGQPEAEAAPRGHAPETESQ